MRQPRDRKRPTLRRVAVGTALALFAATLAVLGPASPAAAAGLVVTTAADVVADDGVCSLREAVEAANTDTASGASAGECAAGSGADVITFGVEGPVDLAGTGVQIHSELTIDGGPSGIVIDGSEIDYPAANAFPIFGGVVTLEGVTLVGGDILNWGGTVVVSRSAVIDSPGDGIVNVGGTATVVNSTLSNSGRDALSNYAGSMAVEFSTITANRNGILACESASTSITASVVAGNVGADVGACGASGNWYTSGGYNVIGDSGSIGGFTGPGDVTGLADPGLGPLGDNGGPTHTHALLEGSPAIDRVTAPVGSDPATDQRRVVRPQGVAKDAGAFERDEVVLLPGGFGTAEGQSGSQIFEIPISLSRPSTETITVDYMSWPCDVFDGCGDGLATQGVDYADPGSGTLTFLPGEMTKTVPVTVYGDLEVEPAYLWGEWFLIRFLNPSPSAVLDTSFFGLGAGVIGNDDP